MRTTVQELSRVANYRVGHGKDAAYFAVDFRARKFWVWGEGYLRVFAEERARKLLRRR